MKIKTLSKRIVWLFAALFISLFYLFESVFSIKAFAEGTQVKYDRTKIEYDLSDMNLLEYALKTEVEVIRAQEYCYSPYSYSSNYGFYIYVYNPLEEGFVETDDNYISLAVGYDENGTPISYEKRKLTYLDKTDDEHFYKFKISDSQGLYEIARNYEKSFKKRRYDLVGFEFKQTDGKTYDTTAEDISIGKTYFYTGYASSGGTVENTLNCEVQTLETLELTVNHTNYIMENYGFADTEDRNISDNVHTVYFSVPERYFIDYGDLQAIRAEWYEYKTSPIFVTSDEEAFEAFYSTLGQDIDNLGADEDWRVIWDYTSWNNWFDDGTLGDVLAPDTYYYHWRYNSEKMSNQDIGAKYYYADDAQNIERMSWLLSRFDADASREEYFVSSKALLEYAVDYTNAHSGVPLVCGKYAADLFSTLDSSDDENSLYELNAIDEDRQKLLKDYENGAKNGYVQLELTANDKQNLIDINKISSFNDLIGAFKGETNDEIDCIQTLGVNDKDYIKALSPKTFASTYYVNAFEAEDIQKYCVEQIELGNRVVFFRFAVTDYYAANARFDDVTVHTMSSEDGFVSQQTVFLDFDVISLTFRNEAQEDTVIGIVADPIDIFSNIVPGNDMKKNKSWDWFDFKVLIGLGLLVLLSPYLMPILNPLFNAIGQALSWLFNTVLKIISLPFKGLGKMFNKRE